MLKSRSIGCVSAHVILSLHELTFFSSKSCSIKLKYVRTFRTSLRLSFFLLKSIQMLSVNAYIIALHTYIKGNVMILEFVTYKL